MQWTTTVLVWFYGWRSILIFCFQDLDDICFMRSIFGGYGVITTKFIAGRGNGVRMKRGSWKCGNSRSEKAISDQRFSWIWSHTEIPNSKQDIQAENSQTVTAVKQFVRVAGCGWASQSRYAKRVLTTATIWHQRKGLVPLVLFCLVVDADGTAQWWECA